MRIYNAWKAAFVEDAEDLHLATKKMFAPLIIGMLDDDVKRVFIASASGGQERLNKLMAKLEKAMQHEFGAESDPSTGELDHGED